MPCGKALRNVGELYGVKNCFLKRAAKKKNFEPGFIKPNLVLPNKPPPNFAPPYINANLPTGDFATFLIALAAFLSYLNIKFLKFPETIGVMILSIVVSLLVAASYFIDQTYFDLVIAFARSIDFKSILFDFLLGALLFAGAIHVNLKGLLEQKRAVIIDATFGVLRSTLIIGTLFYFTASFSNHTGITPKKPIIQIDFDPLALSKFQKVEVAVWGEISRTLAIFNSKLKGQINTEDQRKEVAARWDIWKAEKKKRLLETSDNGISSIAVFETMNKLTPENAVMCVDVGNNAYSFGRYFEPKNQDFLILFVLIGTFLIYIEDITLNQNSYIDESGIKQLGYTKNSNIPVIISLIISYILVYQIPWFNRKKD
jgi:hypothetical protein